MMIYFIISTLCFPFIINSYANYINIYIGKRPICPIHESYPNCTVVDCHSMKMCLAGGMYQNDNRNKQIFNELDDVSIETHVRF